MAAEKNVELDELAFRLYAERIAKLPAQASGDASSAWAYRKAQEFIAVREKVRSGDKAVTAESILADVCAPNLKKTHPLNLVSQRFKDDNGGETKVLNRIKETIDWLRDHPRSDENPIAYEKLDWDVPTTNLARTVLPNYLQTN